MKYTKIISAFILAIGLVAGVGSANATNLTWTAGQNGVVTIGSHNYTIAGGSKADSLVVNDSNIVVTVASGDTFTLISPDGYTLNATGIVASCSTSANQLVVTGAVTSLTITPDTTVNACNAQAPTFSPDTGSYTSARVTISSVTAGATIYYTTNGNNPTTSSLVYSSPLIVYADTTVKALAVKSGMVDSAVSSATYTIINGSGGVISPKKTTTPVVPVTPTTPTTPVLPASQSGVTLYRAEGDGKVYVIKDGKKSWIKTAEAFNAAGYKWTDIFEVAPTVLAALPEDTSSTSGTVLYKAAGDFKVYVIKDGKKSWIKTAAAFAAGGYKWSDVSEVAPSTLAAYPEDTSVSGSTTVKIVNAAKVNLRSINSTKGKVLGKVVLNETYSIIDENGGWYKVQIKSGQTGWISGAYAQKQ